MSTSDTSAPQRGLSGRRILIAEDEFVIAEDLASYFSQLGAHVIGPAGTLADGLRLSEAAEAAVLDINLRGEMSFPIAEVLLARNVPFVFFTAHAGLGVPAHLDRVERFLKPLSYTRVHLSLARRLAAPRENEDEDLVRLIPKLRIAACLLVRDARAADRMVERTLERAVAELNGRDRTVPTEDWIISLLRTIAAEDDRRSMI
jgi:DNA-binding LytR/AlgR family response regulator